MADALSILREHLSNGKVIIEDKENLILSEYSWPKSTPTNYTIWRSRKEEGTTDYYTLYCILYLLKNAQQSYGNYVKQAATDNVGAVRLPDKREIPN